VLNLPTTASRGATAIGLLDIGTTKICCLIGTSDPQAGFKVLGIGHQRSRGIKAGVIIDMDEAEIAVRAAVAQAERMAQLTLDHVYVSVAAGRIQSATVAASAAIEHGVVRPGDIDRVMHGGRAYAERDGRILVHMNRIGWRIDGAHGIADPRGMLARRLVADLHVITADEAPVRNILLLLERCHLAAAGLIAAPYASALAATTEEERRLGITCIDIGGGTTTLAQFIEGHLIRTEAMPIGGHHLSFDIARTLSTPLAEAERIKALYGTLVAANSDECEVITYPLAGEEGAFYQTTKAQVREVLRTRMERLVALMAERIDGGSKLGRPVDRAVVSGGASQLVGLGEFMADRLGRPVRVARPRAMPGVPASVCGPQFSVVLGMAAAVMSGEQGVTAYRDRELLSASGYLGRVGKWLKEGF